MKHSPYRVRYFCCVLMSRIDRTRPLQAQRTNHLNYHHPATNINGIKYIDKYSGYGGLAGVGAGHPGPRSRDHGAWGPGV